MSSSKHKRRLLLGANGQEVHNDLPGQGNFLDMLEDRVMGWELVQTPIGSITDREIVQAFYSLSFSSDSTVRDLTNKLEATVKTIIREDKLDMEAIWRWLSEGGKDIVDESECNSTNQSTRIRGTLNQLSK